MVLIERKQVIEVMSEMRDAIRWYFECHDAFIDFPYDDNHTLPILEMVEILNRAELDLREIVDE